jgi:hypothetical protein
MGRLHSVEENKNFYMTHAGAPTINVLRHGNVNEDVLLTKFAQDAPYHYAEIVKEASTEDASTINALKKNWAADRKQLFFRNGAQLLHHFGGGHFSA